MQDFVGSRQIVLWAMLAKASGLLKAPLNAETLSAHIYCRRPETDSRFNRSIPLIPPTMPIIFTEKRNGKWVRVSSAFAHAQKSRRKLRFAIASRDVPELLARHEFRQGGCDDWGKLQEQLARYIFKVD